MNKLLVVGNDKLGRRLLSRLQPKDDLLVVFDTSTDVKRLWKLLRRRRLKLSWLIQLAWAEWRRPDYNVTTNNKITSNSDLLRLIREDEIERVYLFRAGLIINKKVLHSGAEVLNIHCARIPDYGGLGSIMKALQDGAYEQEATLHRVTTKIDEGEIIATMPYRLSKNLSYRHNEEVAYEAGIQLIINQMGMA